MKTLYEKLSDKDYFPKMNDLKQLWLIAEMEVQNEDHSQPMWKEAIEEFAYYFVTCDRVPLDYPNFFKALFCSETWFVEILSQFTRLLYEDDTVLSRTEIADFPRKFFELNPPEEICSAFAKTWDFYILANFRRRDIRDIDIETLQRLIDLRPKILDRIELVFEDGSRQKAREYIEENGLGDGIENEAMFIHKRLGDLINKEEQQQGGP